MAKVFVCGKCGAVRQAVQNIRVVCICSRKIMYDSDNEIKQLNNCIYIANKERLLTMNEQISTTDAMDMIGSLNG